VKKMVTLLQDQIEQGRSNPGPRLKNDKRIQIVSTQDRRLPPFVKKALKPSPQKIPSK
jgi:hypothetical protein